MKMTSAGVSSGFINTIRSFYSLATAIVSHPHAKSTPIPIHNGVLQGDTLSPLLFSLFLRDIDEYIRERCPSAHGVCVAHDCAISDLLFADDFVLLANPIELNLLLKSLHDYATENELTINTDKSKVMVFRKGGRLPSGLHFWSVRRSWRW